MCACQSGDKKTAPGTTGSGTSDPCNIYIQTLNGAFATKYMEGTMTWEGGISGQVTISGLDYNDMTCGYNVPDCTQSLISMNCDGALYNTEMIIYNIDSLKLGPNSYHRVKE